MMANPFTTPTAVPGARTPLTAVNPNNNNNNRSQSFGTTIKPTPISATPAPLPPQSTDARGSASRKSLGAIPSSASAPAPPSTIINKRLSVMPPQLGNNNSNASAFPSLASVAATPAPAAPRLSIAPTPMAGRKSLGPGMHPPQTPATKDPRRSSVYSGVANRKADTRPIGDKAYMQKQIQKVITFLVEHQWNQAIAPKVLQSPSAKDYLNMVLFVYRLIDPNYVIEGKPEEEIPQLFKNLRYPIPISKSSMQSIGAPHSWPHLLAALEWLCDSVTFIERQTMPSGNSLEPDDEGFLDFLASAYHSMLSGDPEAFSRVDGDLTAFWEARNKAARERVDQRERETASIAEEVRKLREQGEIMPELEKKKSAQLADLARFKQHVEALEAYHVKVNQRFEEAKKDLAAREAERNAALEEKATLQQKIKEQEMNGWDGEKLAKERAQVEDACKASSIAKDIAEKASWEAEMTLSQQLAALEGNIRTYNSIAARLKLAKRAKDKKVEIVFNTNNGPHMSDYIIAQIKNDINPALAVVKTRISAKLTTGREESISLKESLDNTEESISERAEEVARLETAIRSATEHMKQEQIKLNQDIVVIQQDTNAINHETAKLREGLSAAVAKAHKSSETVQGEYEALIKRQIEEKEAYKNHVLMTVDELINHKTYISGAFEALSMYLAAEHQKLLSS